MRRDRGFGRACVQKEGGYDFEGPDRHVGQHCDNGRDMRAVGARSGFASTARDLDGRTDRPTDRRTGRPTGTHSGRHPISGRRREGEGAPTMRRLTATAVNPINGVSSMDKTVSPTLKPPCKEAIPPSLIRTTLMPCSTSSSLHFPKVMPKVICRGCAAAASARPTSWSPPFRACSSFHCTSTIWIPGANECKIKAPPYYRPDLDSRRAFSAGSAAKLECVHAPLVCRRLRVAGYDGVWFPLPHVPAQSVGTPSSD